MGNMSNKPDLQPYNYQSAETDNHRESYRFDSAKIYNKLITAFNPENRQQRIKVIGIFGGGDSNTGLITTEGNRMPLSQATLTVDETGTIQQAETRRVDSNNKNKPYGPSTTITFDQNGLVEFGQTVQQDIDRFTTTIEARRTVEGGNISLTIGGIAEVFNGVARNRDWDGKGKKAYQIADKGQNFRIEMDYGPEDDFTGGRLIGNDGKEVQIPVVKDSGWDRNSIGPSGQKELRSTHTRSKERSIDLGDGLLMEPFYTLVVSSQSDTPHLELSFTLTDERCPSGKVYGYDITFGHITIPNRFPDAYHIAENLAMDVPEALKPTKRYEKPADNTPQYVSGIMMKK